MKELKEIKETDAWPSGNKVVVKPEHRAEVSTDASYPTDGSLPFNFPDADGVYYTRTPYGAVVINAHFVQGRYFKITFSGTETYSGGTYTTDSPANTVTVAVSFSGITETPTATLGSNVVDNGNGTYTANLSSTPTGEITFAFTQNYIFQGYTITPTLTFSSGGGIFNIPTKWSVATSQDGTTFTQPRPAKDLTGEPVLDTNSSIIPSYYTVSF